MEPRNDVIIIAAFGRGVWLASELAKTGRSVCYVDVSGRLGKGSSEDWQGPFPLLKSSQFNDSQWSFLTQGAELENVTNGFTFWLSKGPLELRGPLFEFLRKRNRLHEDVVTYLREHLTLSNGDRSQLRNQIERLSGREGWLGQFAHQIALSTFHSDRSNLPDKIPLLLFHPCFIRHLNEESFNMAHQWLRSSGVKVYTNARVEDISIQSRTIDGIEVASDRSGILPGRQFVWMLTAEEATRFGARVVKSIYKGPSIESSWCWIKTYLNIQESPEREVLPSQFVLAKDMHLPWTHSNIGLTEKTRNPALFRVWTRVASGRRFQRSYISEMAEEMLKEFRNRLPALKIEIDEMPVEFHFGYEELGPPRFPVYLQSEIKKLSRANITNLLYASPEDWGSLDWGTRLSFENKIRYLLANHTAEEGLHDRALHPL